MLRCEFPLGLNTFPLLKYYCSADTINLHVRTYESWYTAGVKLRNYLFHLVEFNCYLMGMFILHLIVILLKFQNLRLCRFCVIVIYQQRAASTRFWEKLAILGKVRERVCVYVCACLCVLRGSKRLYTQHTTSLPTFHKWNEAEIIK